MEMIIGIFIFAVIVTTFVWVVYNISGTFEYEPVTSKQKGFFINLIKKNSVELLQYLN